jgi:hypothetical protein
MRSLVDAFAHQQLDGMQQLQRDFGRRRPAREAGAGAATAPVRHADPRQSSRTALGWLGRVGHELAVRLHLARREHSM